MKSSTFRALVSGKRRGPLAALVRAALSIAETPYTIAVRYRNLRFDRGLGVTHVAVPVVSVGNLTLGGTGKTPMVAMLARWFRTRDLRVVIVSRGYGGQDGEENDEARELRASLPDVPHLQDPDRVAAAQRAIDEFHAQVILLDDGFQHRRLARDLDIVLVDALEPFGFEHVFPRGTLREPLAGWARAHVIALSRADLIKPGERKTICQAVEHYAPHAVWLELSHEPQRLIAAGGESAPLESLREARVAAFCGIGNPAGFEHSLEACDYKLAGLQEFPDHHRYTAADLAQLAEWAASLDATAVVCTHKDLVKINQQRLGPLPLWALEIGVQILDGGEALESVLDAVARRAANG